MYPTSQASSSANTYPAYGQDQNDLFRYDDFLETYNSHYHISGLLEANTIAPVALGSMSNLFSEVAGVGSLDSGSSNVGESPRLVDGGRTNPVSNPATILPATPNFDFLGQNDPTTTFQTTYNLSSGYAYDTGHTTQHFFMPDPSSLPVASATEASPLSRLPKRPSGSSTSQNTKEITDTIERVKRPYNRRSKNPSQARGSDILTPEYHILCKINGCGRYFRNSDHLKDHISSQEGEHGISLGKASGPRRDCYWPECDKEIARSHTWQHLLTEHFRIRFMCCHCKQMMVPRKNTIKNHASSCGGGDLSYKEVCDQSPYSISVSHFS